MGVVSAVHQNSIWCADEIDDWGVWFPVTESQRHLIGVEDLMDIIGADVEMVCNGDHCTRIILWGSVVLEGEV